MIQYLASSAGIVQPMRIVPSSAATAVDQSTASARARLPPSAAVLLCTHWHTRENPSKWSGPWAASPQGKPSKHAPHHASSAAARKKEAVPLAAIGARGWPCPMHNDTLAGGNGDPAGSRLGDTLGRRVRGDNRRRLDLDLGAVFHQGDDLHQGHRREMPTHYAAVGAADLCAAAGVLLFARHIPREA